jgi:uncharacterized protein YbjT (DUF2867 family)
VTEDRLHVVFGTGQVGNALAAHLAGLGLAVRAVSRHRPPGLTDGIDWRPADATDPGAAADAAKGAAGIDLCLHLVRQDYGTEIATQLARQLVVPPQRDGGPVHRRADA